MTETGPTRIDLYSDVHCPYAYLTAYRVRKLLPEYRGRVEVAYRSLALEYVNRQPTPKPILDNETPVLLLEEPDIPYQPWHAPESQWPVTMWPTFEAIKCGERQGQDFAAELDWALRVAFFAESRCISMRHVLLDLAEGIGLEMDRFRQDFDAGVAKRQVLEEAQTGWERLKVEGSPTLVLPAGEQRSYLDLGLPKVKLDEERHYRLAAVDSARCRGDACLDLLRAAFDVAARA